MILIESIYINQIILNTVSLKLFGSLLFFYYFQRKLYMTAYINRDKAFNYSVELCGHIMCNTWNII